MKRLLRNTILAAVLFALATPAVHAHASFIQPEKKHEHTEEFGAQILKITETYAPDQTDKWKTALAEREQLRAKLHELKQSHGFHKKHEEMKQELRKKLESGEITRDEAKKMLQEKHKAFAEKHKQWKEEGKKLKSQLDQAVEKEDKEKIAKTLDAMLERLTKANKMMAERIQSWEAQSAE